MAAKSLKNERKYNMQHTIVHYYYCYYLLLFLYDCSAAGDYHLFCSLNFLQCLLRKKTQYERRPISGEKPMKKIEIAKATTVLIA